LDGRSPLPLSPSQPAGTPTRQSRPSLRLLPLRASACPSPAAPPPPSPLHNQPRPPQPNHHLHLAVCLLLLPSHHRPPQIRPPVRPASILPQQRHRLLPIAPILYRASVLPSRHPLHQPRLAQPQKSRPRTPLLPRGLRLQTNLNRILPSRPRPSHRVLPASFRRHNRRFSIRTHKHQKDQPKHSPRIAPLIHLTHAPLQPHSLPKPHPCLTPASRPLANLIDLNHNPSLPYELPTRSPNQT
jgi:hypothetical protein